MTVENIQSMLDKKAEAALKKQIETDTAGFDKYRHLGLTISVELPGHIRSSLKDSSMSTITNINISFRDAFQAMRETVYNRLIDQAKKDEAAKFLAKLDSIESEVSELRQELNL